MGADERMEDMKNPIHIDIIHKIPGYMQSKRRLSMRYIRETMKEYGYDEDYIENISDDFCQGFGVAKDIIIEMLSKKYWCDEQEGYPE